MSIKQLRPSQAAGLLGIGLSTFWKLAKEDPDFPKMTRLSPKCTIVSESDLQTYIARKQELSGAMPRNDFTKREHRQAELMVA